MSYTERTNSGARVLRADLMARSHASALILLRGLDFARHVAEREGTDPILRDLLRHTIATHEAEGTKPRRPRKKH